MDRIDLFYGYPNRIVRVFNIKIVGHEKVFDEELNYDYIVLENDTHLVIDLDAEELDAIKQAVQAYLSVSM